MSFTKKYQYLFWGVLLFCFMGLLTAPVVKAQNRIMLQAPQDNSSDAFLGVSMQDVTATNMSEYRLTEERGAIVRSVQQGSPAEAANIKEDDVIVEFAGQQVWSSFQLSRLVKETPVGRKTPLTVSRDGKRINLTATLAAREPSRAAGNFNELIEPFRSRGFDFRMERPDQPDRTERPDRSTRPDGQRNRPDADRSNEKPRLGVQVVTLTGQMAEHLGVTGKKGVLISEVTSGTASDGKLKAGDVIVGIGNDDVDSPEDLTRIIRNAAAGQITVKIIRDKKPIAVAVDLPSDGTEKSYRL